MTPTHKNTPDTSSKSGSEIYEKAQKLTTQSIDQLLKNFFSELSEAKFHHLSIRDTDRLIAQVQRKQDIILSSLLFQIKNNFADFKASRQFRFQQSSSANEQVLGLVGTNQYIESIELESIVSHFQQKYDRYYLVIAKQLACCIDRSDVDEIDNPLHIKHLCLSFQSTIDTLNLVIAQRIALYKIFASSVIAQIEPLYISLEQHLIQHQPATDLNPVPIEKPVIEEPAKSPEPSHSVAMAHIPVLMGIFQKFKDKLNDRDSIFSDLLLELKKALTQKGINEFDSLIDKLSLSFNFIFSDEDLPEQIKQQLARLQIFIFMSEIQQSGFTSRSSHPARRLIDTIVRTEVDFDKNNLSDRSGSDFLRSEIDKISSNPFIEADYYAYLCQLYIEHTTEVSASSTSTTPSVNDDKPIKSQALEVESQDVQQIVELDELANKCGTIDIVLETEKPDVENIKTDNIYVVVQSIVYDITLPLSMQGRSLILFDEVWFPLLLEVARSQGFKFPAWHRVVTIAKTQAWVLTPKNNQRDLDKLISALAHIENSLLQSMQSLSLPAEQQASLLEFLEHEQADVIKQSNTLIEETGQIESTTLVKQSSTEQTSQNQVNSQDDPNTETIDEFSNLMETGRFHKSEDMLEALQFDNKAIPEKDKPSISSTDIHKSDWVEIKKGDNTILAKLTWKNESGSQFIFVDREGQRVCEISGGYLDQELKKGNISLISSTPVRSQRPAFSIIQTLS